MSRADRGKKKKKMETREMEVEVGVLLRADGSARCRASSEGSSALASVYAPRSATHGRATAAETGERASVDVSVRAGAAGGGSRSRLRSLEAICAGALEAVLVREAYPRCSISVHVLIERDVGCVESCVVNAAASACVDAGLQMTGMLAAGSFAVDREGRVRAEPGWTEIEAAEAMVHLVLVSRGIDGAGGKADGNDVVACEAVGLLRPEALEACVVLGRKLAPRYVSAVRRSFEACAAY